VDRQHPSRAEVEALVRGRTVVLRGPDAVERPVPGWVAAAAAEVGRETAAERAAVRHPADHGAIADAWVAALRRPFEPFEAVCRVRHGDGWAVERIVFVNLLEHPDVGGMLLAMAPVEPLSPDGSAAADAAAEAVEGIAPGRWMTFSVDEAFTVHGVQGETEDLLGCSPGSMEGRPMLDVLQPVEMDSAMRTWLAMSSQPGVTHVSHVSVVGGDGEPRWLQLALFNRDGAAGAREILVVCLDVTEQRRQEDELRASHRELSLLADELRLLADEVPSPVFRCDAAGTFTFRNGRWTESALLDPAAERLHDVVAPLDRPKVQTAIERLRAGDPDAGALEVRSTDGRAVLALSLRPVPDPAGRPPAVFVGTVADVTATVALRERADRDAVTGLLSRPALEDQLRAALADDAASTLVLFLDLDDFKAVNDNHGHDTGDEVLAAVGRRLRQAVRPGDAVGRYGGDEFVIVYRDARRASAAELEHRIAGAFDEPVATAAGDQRVRASIGSARPVPGDDLGALLRRADLAMFASKRSRQRRDEPIILSGPDGAHIDLPAEGAPR
jgi:diguanylate cyclase (GGDEF)-like protein